ncbi:hypothetical protein PR048_001863 [Dryococelus australis]|uniref:Uncharacterized protein n=1 Tax=Dryococelus australis TaxID=614101 RepID=A0ABQ9IIQ5_9NEOP|nr:hypothetical protein PR048_001863 [Dryococelus australis]
MNSADCSGPREPFPPARREREGSVPAAANPAPSSATRLHGICRGPCVPYVTRILQEAATDISFIARRPPTRYNVTIARRRQWQKLKRPRGNQAEPPYHYGGQYGQCRLILTRRRLAVVRPRSCFRRCTNCERYYLNSALIIKPSTARVLITTAVLLFLLHYPPRLISEMPPSRVVDCGTLIQTHFVSSWRSATPKLLTPMRGEGRCVVTATFNMQEVTTLQTWKIRAIIGVVKVSRQTPPSRYRPAVICRKRPDSKYRLAADCWPTVSGLRRLDVVTMPGRQWNDFNERFRLTSNKMEEMLILIGHNLRHATARSHSLTEKLLIQVTLHWLGAGVQYH